MVQFSSELCINLFKYNLRNITVQNKDIENIQCAGAKYLRYNTYLNSLYNVPSTEYYSVYLHKIHQYNKPHFVTENSLLF